MSSRLEELISRTHELAALPSSVVHLLHVLRDQTAGTDEVVGILERDLALTANLLKLANSAYYGRQREINSVRQAVVVLGNRALANLAIATGMTPILRRDLATYQLSKEEFWHHALVSAAAAAWITVSGGAGARQSQAFTAGLIHDMGKILIDAECHRESLQLAAGSESGELCQREKDLLGFDHCEAGAMLAEHWGFPAELVWPLRYHHAAPMPQLEPANEKTAAVRQQVAVVRTSDLVAHYLSQVAGEVSTHDADIPASLKERGISAALLGDFQRNLSENFAEHLVAVTGICP